jgi:hypothetical protein
VMRWLKKGPSSLLRSRAPTIERFCRSNRHWRLKEELEPGSQGMVKLLSGIHPGYSCKEGRIVEDGLLVEFPCTPTRTPAL